MTKTTASCSSSSRHGRLFTALITLVLLALGASACAASPEIGAVPIDSQSSAQPANETADDGAETASSTEPQADNGYGPKPVLQTFRISADSFLWSGDTVGLDYTFTEIDDDDQDVEYIAIGSDTAIRASYLSQGANQVEVCVEGANGCGGGDPSTGVFFSASLLKISFAIWAPQTIDGPRVAGGILLGEGVGWEISDENYTLHGRPGRCYRSLGFYQWAGDPEPTETAFPAGDIACVLYYETSSEYLASYDFGGDGTIEIEALRLADSYTEADLVHADYAPAQFEQAALSQILEVIGLDGELEVIAN